MLAILFRLVIAGLGLGLIAFISFWLLLIALGTVVLFVLSQLSGSRISITRGDKKIGYIQNFKYHDGE